MCVLAYVHVTVLSHQPEPLLGHLPMHGLHSSKHGMFSPRDKLAEEAQLAVQEADTVFWALGTTRKV